MREVQRKLTWWEVGETGFATATRDEARAAAWSQGVEYTERSKLLACGFEVEVDDWISVVDLHEMAADVPSQVYRVIDDIAATRHAPGPRSWRTSVDARGVLLPMTRSPELCGLFEGRFIGVSGSTVDEVMVRARRLMDMHRAGDLL